MSAQTTTRPGSGGSGARAGRYQTRRAWRREAEKCSSGTASARGPRRITGDAGERTLAAQLAEPRTHRAAAPSGARQPAPEIGIADPSDERLQFGAAFIWAPRGAAVASKPRTKDRAGTRSFSFCGRALEAVHDRACTSPAGDAVRRSRMSSLGRCAAQRCPERADHGRGLPTGRAGAVFPISAAALPHIFPISMRNLEKSPAQRCPAVTARFRLQCGAIPALSGNVRRCPGRDRDGGNRFESRDCPARTRFSGRASPEVPQKHHRSSGRVPHMLGACA